MEERSVRESDWTSAELSTQKADTETNVSAHDNEASRGEIDPALRKRIFNAPKRIQKLESLIEKAEARITEIGEEMMSSGNDVGKLVDLNSEKEKLEETVADYMEEWQELEELLAQATA